MTVTAPTRIDLAGGTLDIYPLYLLEEDGLTLNAAISIRTGCSVTPRPGTAVELRARDLALSQSAAHPDALELSGPLGLVARAVRAVAPQGGVRVETWSEAPAGSGLGASSSLLVSVLSALSRFTGRQLHTPAMIALASSLEAQAIRVPTGRQDYYPAAIGGLNAIWFRAAGDEVEPLVEDPARLRALEDRLILTYTGEAHLSADVNWRMVRAYVDGDPDAGAGIRTIKGIALGMREALRRWDLDEFGRLLGEEWEQRRRIADGVTTPQIDRLVDAARAAGSVASKVCGAGGGGCLITLAPAGRRMNVAEALAAAGGTLLSFRFSRRGVRVEAGR